MTKRILLFIILAGLAVGGYKGFQLYRLIFSPTVVQNTSLYVYPDHTVDSIAINLVNKGVIESASDFLWVAEKMKFTTARTGHYALIKGSSLKSLIQQLRAGNQTPVRVTFNNIRTIEEFCRIISRQLALDSAALYQTIYEGELIKSGEFSQYTILNAFIPDTYEFYWNVSAERFIERMLREYHAFWNENRKSQAKSIGLTAHEVGTLASIVDAETIKAEERAEIAGVYINRLKRNMRLQADPTIRFLMQDTIRRVLYKDLRIESPYNTYLYAGLPPGPIRMPSPQSIDAVLNPEQHNYLYFCAREDLSGYHRFAKTLQQHNINRRKYQQAINKTQNIPVKIYPIQTTKKYQYGIKKQHLRNRECSR